MRPDLAIAIAADDYRPLDPRGVQRVELVVEEESEALAWVVVDEVDRLELHPGFALSWPLLRGRLEAAGADTAPDPGADAGADGPGPVSPV